MKNLFLLSFILIQFVSCGLAGGEELSVCPVIDVEEGVKTFAIRDLSHYATDIRYVKLETTQECLVTQEIKNVYLEDGKIFIMDGDPFLKVFDAETGKYLYNIGSKGQGPGELPSLTFVDMNVKENSIILGWDIISNRYNLAGTFIEKLSRPQLPEMNDVETVYANMVMLDKDLFAAGIRNRSDHQVNAAVVFDKQLNIIRTLKSYKDPVQASFGLTWSLFDQSGFFYRSLDRVHFFRGICDTIYVYNPQEQTFLPHLCFDFGKHKSNYKRTPGEENPSLIKAHTLFCENDQALFIHFHTSKASPEPFEDEVWRDRWYKGINRNVYGIYDKKEQRLHFLLQPIPAVMGLRNDIDNGLPFWSVNISSKNELIDCQHAYKFLERASHLENPSEYLKELIASIDEEDNPIVIIAKARQ